MADNFASGDRRFGAIEFSFQIQLSHELLRVNLLGQMVNKIKNFLFIHG